MRDAAQRSVDLTVAAVENGTNAERKADVRVWRVEVDPDLDMGTAPAGTEGYPEDESGPRDIYTVFNDKILEGNKPNRDYQISGDLTARGGDAYLLALGAHELGHGSKENMAMAQGLKKEKDASDRAKETAASSPDVQRGLIK